MQQTGPITRIDLWTSYLEDTRLMPDPWFSLAIYEDIPASQSPTGYSIPGNLLWDVYVPATVERLVGTRLDEGFYDPAANQNIGRDTELWQYTFEFDLPNAFWQDEGNVYWLGVHHTFDLNLDDEVDTSDFNILNANTVVRFGWKTSTDHWNDDAVWTGVDTLFQSPHVTPQTTDWNELRYPPVHPLQFAEHRFVVCRSTRPLPHRSGISRRTCHPRGSTLMPRMDSPGRSCWPMIS